MTQALKVRDEEGQRLPGAPQPENKFAEFFRRLWNRVAEYPRRFRQFLHDVRVEMRQVTWPTVTDVRATTMVVILTVFFFGLFLAIVDFGVSQLIERVLKFKP